MFYRSGNVRSRPTLFAYSRSTSQRSSRPRRGYSLHELAVVLAVVALLAGLITPLYGRVTSMVKINVAEHTLGAVQRSVVADAAFGGLLEFSDVARAVNDLPGKTPGGGSRFTTRESTAVLPNRSYLPDTISAYIDQPQRAVYLALAAGGECAYASSIATVVRTWHISGDETCSGYEASGAVPVDHLTAPSAPEQLSAAITADRTISVTWVAPAVTGGSSVSSYEITDIIGVNETTYSYPLAAIASNAGTYSITFPELDPGSTHRYRVAATNSTGTGPSAGPTNIITVLRLPVAPTLSGERGNGSAALDWNAVSAGDASVDYRIYRYINGVPTLVGSTTGTNFNVTGLVNGEPSQLAVAGYTIDGEGPQSNIVAVMPIGEPVAITGFAATFQGADVVLDWTAPPTAGAAPVDTTQVLRDGTVVANLSSGHTSYTDTSTHAGRHYDYAIRGVNTMGTGPTTTLGVDIIDVPDAPTSLTAEAHSGSVSLHWNAITSSATQPVAGYAIYQEIAGLYTLVRSTSTTSTDITGLNNGDTYRFKVAAYGPAGEGLRSDIATATPLAAPALIGNLVSTLADHAANITWQAAVTSIAAPVGAIDVIRDGTVIATLTPSSSTYTFTGLTVGRTYTVGVRPRNDVATGVTTTLDVTAVAVPVAPGSLTAIPGDAHTILGWDASSSTMSAPVTGYRIYQVDSGAATLVGSTSSTSFDIVGLTNGITYEFQVAAYGPAGEGIRSATVSSSPLAAPVAITNLTATVANRSVTISWSPAVSTSTAPVTQIDILLDGGVITTLTGDMTTYLYSGLTAGTSYTLGVRPANAAATGAATTVDITAITVPGAPADVTAEAGNSSVTLDWSAVAGTTSTPVTGYRIYQEISGVMTLIDATSSTQLLVSELANGLGASFQIAAYGPVGEGLRSTTVTTTPLGPPAAIAGLLATLGDSAVTLTWTAPALVPSSQVNGIQILRNGTVVTTLARTATSYTFTVESVHSSVPRPTERRSSRCPAARPTACRLPPTVPEAKVHRQPSRRTSPRHHQPAPSSRSTVATVPSPSTSSPPRRSTNRSPATK